MFGHLDLSFGGDHYFHKCQCSLCHALGKEYGSLARFLTNGDMALCLAVILNSMGSDVLRKKKICPLAKRKEIIGSDHSLMRYLSAVTILLVSEKIKDDIYDENRKFPKILLSWVDKRSIKAKGILNQLGFDPILFERAFARQRDLEKSEGPDFLELAEPTAQVMSGVYLHAARLAGQTENQKAMGQIGYSLGRIIYLLDSLEDFQTDLNSHSFNPIKKCFSRELGNNSLSLPDPIREKMTVYLKSAHLSLQEALNNLPESIELQKLLGPEFWESIQKRVWVQDPPGIEVSLSFWEKVKQVSPVSLLSSPSLALASNGRDSGSGCYSSLTFLLIMLVAYGVICRGCLGKRGCSSRPNQVTVDHGCGGKKTYKKDPCSGRYKEDGCC